MLKSLLTVAALAALSTVHAGSLRDALGKRIQENREAQWEQQEDQHSLALPAGIRRLGDLSYGSHTKQRLDVYVPAQTVTRAPVVVMVHGGAWRYGDKRAAAVIDNKIRRWVLRGLIFVSVNYRLFPDADLLHQAEDVMHAIGFVQQHASEWGGDGNKIILMGHSAGAHLVDLVSAAPAKAKNRGVRSWLGSVSLDSAALDVVKLMQGRHYRFYDDVMGSDAAYWESISPYHNLTAEAPPMLLVCSTKRPDQPCAEAASFLVHAKTLGLKTQILERSLSHKEINQQLGVEGEYTNAVERFISGLDSAIADQLRQTH